MKLEVQSRYRSGALDGGFGGCPPIDSLLIEAEQRDSDAQPLAALLAKGQIPFDCAQDMLRSPQNDRRADVI